MRGMRTSIRTTSGCSSALGEVPALVCGLVAYTWIAVALVSVGRREAAAAGTAEQVAVAVS
jgi:hypothetical protein